MSKFFRDRVAPSLRGLTDTAIEAGLTAGLVARKQGFLVPSLRGADPILEALDHVSEQLESLATRAAAGEDVTDQAEELKRKQAELEGLKGGEPNEGPREGETEVEFLRRWKQEREERGEARKAVEMAVAATMQKETEKADRMKGYAADAVRDLFGSDGSLDVAVRSILQSHRPASRFAGQGASDDFADSFNGSFSGRTGTALELREHEGEIQGYGYTVNGNKEAIRTGGDREIEFLRKRGLPKEQGGEGIGLGQFITLVNAYKFGMLTDPQRRFFDHMRTKALAEGTPSAGGVLVPREYMGDLLGTLRAQAIVRRANPRIQRFSREMYQTSVSTGATAFYTQENAQIPVSEETFAEAPLLTPKNLTALVPASNYLLSDAEAADDFVRADLAEVMALREDLAFLRGTGTLGEPRGFRNIVGITLDPIAPTGSGVQLTIANLRRIRAIFRSLNAGAVRPVWFFNPEFLTYLETLQEMSGGQPTGRTLLDAEIISYDDDTLTSGRFDGIRFFTTTQLPNGTTGANPSTELYLVNMAETIVGENQELEIDISREASYWDGAAWVSAFQNNQSVFRAVLRHDIAHRRPNQIVVQTGARTT